LYWALEIHLGLELYALEDFIRLILLGLAAEAEQSHEAFVVAGHVVLLKLDFEMQAELIVRLKRLIHRVEFLREVAEVDEPLWVRKLVSFLYVDGLGSLEILQRRIVEIFRVLNIGNILIIDYLHLRGLELTFLSAFVFEARRLSVAECLAEGIALIPETVKLHSYPFLFE